MTKKKYYIAMGLVLFLAGSALFSLGIYNYLYKQSLAHLDEELNIAVESVSGVLNNKLHTGILNSDSISKTRQLEIEQLLSRVVKNTKIEFIYSMVKKEGKIFFVTSNLTEEEIKNNEPILLTPYEEADPAIFRAFDTGAKQTAEYTDKWGVFRSVFQPRIANDGQTYVIGADISLNAVKALNVKSTRNALLTWLALALLFIPLFYLYAKSLLREKQLENDKYFVDTLTGLPNRSQLLKDLESAQDPHLAIIEFNNFHEVNMAHGPHQGDQILKQFANRLAHFTDNTIKNHKTYRMHGDQFAVLLNQDITSDSIKRSMLRFLEIIGNEFEVDDNKLYLSLSIGGSSGQKDALELAEMALKESNKTQHPVIFYSRRDGNLPEVYKKNLQDVATLKLALKEDRIVPYFMPIENLVTGEIDKYECLARMVDEEGNIMQMPNQFLAAAYRGNMYSGATRAILNGAIEMIRSTQKVMTINISSSDIFNPRTSQFIYRRIKATGLGKHIEFEILETENIVDYHAASRYLNKLKTLGCRIGIDDLGKAYSNYERLTKLPIDFVKIDKTVISNLFNAPGAFSLVREIVKFAHVNKLQTIAEFCTNKETYDTVQNLGLDFAQGFYVGKPAPTPSPSKKMADVIVA